jgi:hypothetical protein
MLITVQWLQNLWRFSVNEQSAWKFDMEKFNFNKVKEVESKEKYNLKIPDRFGTLEKGN